MRYDKSRLGGYIQGLETMYLWLPLYLTSSFDQQEHYEALGEPVIEYIENYIFYLRSRM